MTTMNQIVQVRRSTTLADARARIDRLDAVDAVDARVRVGGSDASVARVGALSTTDYIVYGTIIVLLTLLGVWVLQDVVHS